MAADGLEGGGCCAVKFGAVKLGAAGFHAVKFSTVKLDDAQRI